MLVVFRLSASKNIGIGHLVRCVALAKELDQRKVPVHFLIDHLDESVNGFLESFHADYLYSEKQEELDEALDAHLTLEKLKELNLEPEWLVLDSYRLGINWETPVRQSGLKLFVLDDLMREHDCDALLDYKWRGINTNKEFLKLVNQDTSLLLGPEYLILPEQPSGFNKDAVIKRDKTGEFHILISFGGGGEHAFLKALLDQLLTIHEAIMSPIIVKVVLGPLFENSEAISQLYKESPAEISFQFTVGKTNIYQEIQWCDLFIGPAGGTLYQLRWMKKPAITFSTALNQQTESNLLDDIGQYLHINALAKTQLPQLKDLVIELLQNYSRVLKLFSNARIVFDSLGTQKITDFLINRTQDEDCPERIVSNLKCDETVLGSEGFTIRPVLDSDINHYLDSRNLPSNRQNMITDLAIEAIDHYRWWFITERKSFLLAKHSQPILYIWDEVKHVDSQPYLIGGWFVCSEKTNYQDTMVALEWQLKRCAVEYPSVKWLAVISKQNRYVKLLNDFFEFKDVEKGSLYDKAIQQLFPDANREEFYYVYK